MTSNDKPCGIAEKMVVHSTKIYATRVERAALRCALGDAAHLCDAIMREIASEWKGRGGVTKKRGQELAEIAKRCGDEIWKMREKIEVPL